MKRGLLIGLVVGVVLSLGIGTGYWAYARQHMDGNSHMMSQRQGTKMGGGQQMGMMKMPMMHGDMSEEEMRQYCRKMTKYHEQKQSMMNQNANELNALVGKMKQAGGNEKLQAIEEVVVELVNQHNHRRKMMASMRPRMMKMMMGMHQMDESRRQMMMQRMQDCPMMQGMMGGSENGKPMDSDKHKHGK